MDFKDNTKRILLASLCLSNHLLTSSHTYSWKNIFMHTHHLLSLFNTHTHTHTHVL